MGKIAEFLTFYFYTLRGDEKENRLHIHISKKKKGKKYHLAKIWLESNGEKDIQVAYNLGIDERKLKKIIAFLDKNYNKIVKNIDKTYKGFKTEIIMCKIQGVTAELHKIAFERRGYITFYFEDKRIVSVPLSNFPAIKKLNAKQRKEWEVIDDQYFSFLAINEIYSITDILYM